MTQAHDPLLPFPQPIPALLPRDGMGHQFVCYADSCSGVPQAAHASTFATVNAVVARLQPPPEFICFPGDEIVGLSADHEILRQQWQYWFVQEMAWLDQATIPVYHTTGNHTTYDAASEAVFREVMAHLPQNGPPDQIGLTYFVRDRDLLLICINTLWSGLGGEGWAETSWLDQVLAEHADATYKFVVGHHPVHPVNGFSGAYQRELAHDNGRRLWQILVKHRVFAYLCSHILAFDVQVHTGILQILTAGAGTAHRMPEELEYLHCVQLALDQQGMRYQVLDTAGHIREWLAWPIVLPSADTWPRMAIGAHSAPIFNQYTPDSRVARVIVWQFSGICPSNDNGTAQTLLSGWNAGPLLAPLWIGLRGCELSLSVLLSPVAGRSPHLWQGPQLTPNAAFSIQLALHAGMGPGGILWRWNDTTTWSSLTAASAWGAEQLTWPAEWSIGHAQGGRADRPFRGSNLIVTWHTQMIALAQ
ncbi:hypothetical protein BH10CHL1_BH10CHL1_37340 [soil metagenome]